MPSLQRKSVSLRVKYDFREIEVTVIRSGYKDQLNEADDEVIRKLNDAESHTNDVVIKLKMTKKTAVRAIGIVGSTSMAALIARMLGTF